MQFKGNGKLACRLVRKNINAADYDPINMVSSSDLVVPTLKDASKEGFLFGEFVEKKSCYKFLKIEIDPTSGRGEGDLTLEFLHILSMNEDTIDSTIKKYESDFTFTSDEAKSEKQNKIREQRRPLESKLRDIEELDGEMKEDIKLKESVILNILGRGQQQIFKLWGRSLNTLTLEEVESKERDMKKTQIHVAPWLLQCECSVSHVLVRKGS